MKLIRRLRKPQPVTKKKVIELEVGGPLGRWMASQNWGAFTLPLPFLVLIFYWSADPQGDVDGRIRVHEFVHVTQDERSLFFAVSWVKYLWAMWSALHLSAWRAGVLTLGQVLMDAYYGNAYEVEAYQTQVTAQNYGLPSWAQ